MENKPRNSLQQEQLYKRLIHLFQKCIEKKVSQKTEAGTAAGTPFRSHSPSRRDWKRFPDGRPGSLRNQVGDFISGVCKHTSVSQNDNRTQPFCHDCVSSGGIHSHAHRLASRTRVFSINKKREKLTQRPNVVTRLSKPPAMSLPARLTAAAAGRGAGRGAVCGRGRGVRTGARGSRRSGCGTAPPRGAGPRH